MNLYKICIRLLTIMIIIVHACSFNMYGGNDVHGIADNGSVAKSVVVPGLPPLSSIIPQTTDDGSLGSLSVKGTNNNLYTSSDSVVGVDIKKKSLVQDTELSSASVVGGKSDSIVVPKLSDQSIDAAVSSSSGNSALLGSGTIADSNSTSNNVTSAVNVPSTPSSIKAPSDGGTSLINKSIVPAKIVSDSQKIVSDSKNLQSDIVSDDGDDSDSNIESSSSALLGSGTVADSNSTSNNVTSAVKVPSTPSSIKAPSDGGTSLINKSIVPAKIVSDSQKIVSDSKNLQSDIVSDDGDDSDSNIESSSSSSFHSQVQANQNNLPSINVADESSNSNDTQLDNSDSSNENVENQESDPDDSNSSVDVVDSAPATSVDDNVTDTIDVTSNGNWLLKRVWWEKTEEVYEEIKAVFAKVMSARSIFFDKQNELNKKIDSFYLEMGFDHGVLQDLLHYSKDLIDQSKKQNSGFLSEKERAFVVKISAKERELDQLLLDVKAIQELNNKIDHAIKIVLDQVSICNQYEDRAWENFKDIARELNDKAARVKYYDTKGLLNDINKVYAYLTNDLVNYFNQITQSADDHIKKIFSRVNNLRSEGIDLKKESIILSKADDIAVHDNVKNTDKNKNSNKDLKSNTINDNGIISYIGNMFNFILQFVYSFFESLWCKIYSLFGC